jgi:hypothetical protein
MRSLIAVSLAAALGLGGCGNASGTGSGSSPVPAPATVVTPSPVPLVPSPRLIGRLNPAVTQKTLRTTVCTVGWTKTIRPPVSYTNALKRKQIPAGADPSAYEEDHLMPLELGGDPTNPKNLAPVLWKRARLDDAWETRLHKELCAGKVSLSQAQVTISMIKRHP